MNISDKILELDTYTYKDYKMWKGDWELIKGHPQAMSPSPKYEHQKFSQRFSSATSNILANCSKECNCEVLYELDWLIDNETIVRPDCMIVCGKINEDYLTFPPTLILEISSPSIRMKDRNTKYDLYEMCGVKYYIIADPEKKICRSF